MSFSQASNNQVSGAQFPAPHIRLQIELEWRGRRDESVEVTSLVLHMLKIGEAIPNLWLTLPSTFSARAVSEREKITASFNVPVGNAFLSAIETWRMARDGAFQIEASLIVETRAVQSVALRRPNRGEFESETVNVREVISPDSSHVNCWVNVGRDEWLRALTALGWGEMRIFELPLRSLTRHEQFNQAFDLIDDAQRALRNGDWGTVVIKVRKAVETAATTASLTGDLKNKFAALAAQVFPLQHDDSKRKTLDALMSSTGFLRHDEAHGNNLHVAIEREDAELAMTTGLSIFRYIAESLRRAERST